ncbi:MAG: hypothetical protein A3H69_05315 [Candidatus Sungbacteria bacterium RIFCSPLOWO2_02_FULL_47_9]|nr:MAG: hypothetical protein A3H69_05315 [Candidatus Sungbacteria bacterium RIFCSPLOWO2_02_FULL_47_9]
MVQMLKMPALIQVPEPLEEPTLKMKMQVPKRAVVLKLKMKMQVPKRAVAVAREKAENNTKAIKEEDPL